MREKHENTNNKLSDAELNASIVPRTVSLNALYLKNDNWYLLSTVTILFVFSYPPCLTERSDKPFFPTPRLQTMIGNISIHLLLCGEAIYSFVSHSFKWHRTFVTRWHTLEQRLVDGEHWSCRTYQMPLCRGIQRGMIISYGIFPKYQGGI